MSRSWRQKSLKSRSSVHWRRVFMTGGVRVETRGGRGETLPSLSQPVCAQTACPSGLIVAVRHIWDRLAGRRRTGVVEPSCSFQQERSIQSENRTRSNCNSAIYCLLVIILLYAILISQNCFFMCAQSILRRSRWLFLWVFCWAEVFVEFGKRKCLVEKPIFYILSLNQRLKLNFWSGKKTFG